MGHPLSGRERGQIFFTDSGDKILIFRDLETVLATNILE
jgi:hypothetical protein